MLYQICSGLQKDNGDDWRKVMNWPAAEACLRDLFEQARGRVTEEAKTALNVTMGAEETKYHEVDMVKWAWRPLILRSLVNMLDMDDSFGTTPTWRGTQNDRGRYAAELTILPDDYEMPNETDWTGSTPADNHASHEVPRGADEPPHSNVANEPDSADSDGDTDDGAVEDDNTNLDEGMEDSHDEESDDDQSEGSENDRHETSEVDIKREDCEGEDSDDSGIALNELSHGTGGLLEDTGFPENILCPRFEAAAGQSSLERSIHVSSIEPPDPELTLQFQMIGRKDHGSKVPVHELARQVARQLHVDLGGDGFTHVSLYSVRTRIWLAHYSTTESARAAHGRRVHVASKGEMRLRSFYPKAGAKAFTGARTLLCQNIPKDLDMDTIADKVESLFPESTLQFETPGALALQGHPNTLRGAYLMVQFDSLTDIVSFHCQVDRSSSTRGWMADFHSFGGKECCLVCSDNDHRFYECPHMKEL